MRILQNVRTKEDLEKVIFALDAYRQAEYKTSPSQEISLPPEIKAEFEKSADHEAYFKAIRQALLDTHVLELTVARSFPEEAVTRIAAWVKQNLGDSIILDFDVDPDVLAGCEISFNGKYADYSFRDAFAKAIEGIKF